MTTSMTLSSLEAVVQILRSYYQLQQLCETTEVIWNANRVLGKELERDRSRRIIKVAMSANIAEACEKYSIDPDTRKYVPIPQSGCIIKDEEFEAIHPQEHSMFLNPESITLYMGIVGLLI